MKEEPVLSAFEYKDQGNKFYNSHRFDEAINSYNKAIIKNPSVPTFFTNRALCYLKLQSWELAAQDCRRALDMEPTLIKGHFFLGQALVEQGHYDEAIKHLQRANDLAKDQKLNFGEEIAYQLRTAKKRRWSLMEEKRIKEEIELEKYLTKLIERDREEQLIKAREEFLSGDDEERKGAEKGEEPREMKAEDLILLEETINEKCDHHTAELSSLFGQLDVRRKKREVPDHLCGKISFEILRDPVITPSGITYDRKDIEDHLHKVGHFDPVTRHPLVQDQLIPNLSMKEVVDSYLAENEWAHYY